MYCSTVRHFFSLFHFFSFSLSLSFQMYSYLIKWFVLKLCAYVCICYRLNNVLFVFAFWKKKKWKHPAWILCLFFHFSRIIWIESTHIKNDLYKIYLEKNQLTKICFLFKCDDFFFHLIFISFFFFTTMWCVCIYVYVYLLMLFVFPLYFPLNYNMHRA